MLPYIHPLYLLSAHSHSTTPEGRKGEVSDFVVEPRNAGVMSHETMPNVFLPMELDEHLQLNEDLPQLTTDQLAEELQLSYPVLSESFSSLSEPFLPTELEEISVETEDGNRLGQKRVCSEKEDEQAKKKTRFS